MARRRQRKKRRIDPLFAEDVLSIGALAADDLVAGGMLTASNVLGADYFCNSVDLSMSIKGATAGEGPLLIGIAAADYSDAEIEAWVEATTNSYSPANLVEREIQNRFIRRIGMFDLSNASEDWNDGVPKRIRLNWLMRAGNQGLSLFAYNQGTSTLTTGAVISHSSEWWGRWVH